jgi:peptide/nickel transport system permease protein
VPRAWLLPLAVLAAVLCAAVFELSFLAGDVWMHVSNLTVAGLVGLGALAGIAIQRNRIWREAARSLARRRPLALLVVGAYVGIALLDSIAWVGGASEASADRVSVYQARSALDRLFDAEARREKTYSAPLASVEFYGGGALEHPGSHLLGTDVLGRDVLYLTLKGVRVSLLIGSLTSLIAIPFALLFGVSAGYFGGRWDAIVFFVVTTFASIPPLLLLIALVVALASVLERGALTVCIALGVAGWVSFCRIARGETLKLRELPYVEAARVLGVSRARTIFRHILPNLSHLIAISFVLTFSSLVLSEIILAYLGVGVPQSWGTMIDQARDELSREPIVWWNLAGASSALFVLLLAVNQVGDAVRDVLDPRTLRERA